MIDRSFRRKKKPRSDFGWRFPLGAILFHIGVLVLLVVAEIYYEKELIKKEVRRMLEVHTISNKDLEHIMTRARVVDTEWAEKKDRIDKDTEKRAYRGERTQRVKKESVSNKGGSSRGRDFVPPLIKNPNFQSSSESSRSRDGLGQKVENAKRSKLQRGSMDYVEPGIKVSDITLLNTNEYVRAAYENRVREAIYAAWVPRIETLRDSGKVRLDIGIYITVAQIFVERDGTVTMVKINKSSGFKLIDLAGAEAVMEVGSIPNPPRDIFLSPFNGSFDFYFIIQVNPYKRPDYNVYFDKRLNGEGIKSDNPWNKAPAHRRIR